MVKELNILIIINTMKETGKNDNKNGFGNLYYLKYTDIVYYMDILEIIKKQDVVKYFIKIII